jgi:hypothetical protein
MCLRPQRGDAPLARGCDYPRVLLCVLVRIGCYEREALYFMDTGDDAPIELYREYSAVSLSMSMWCPVVSCSYSGDVLHHQLQNRLQLQLPQQVRPLVVLREA